MQKSEILSLKKGSAKIRIETLKMLKWRRYGHLGGAMSIVELLSVLYNKHMKYRSNDPLWDGRDYLVLSKGHAGPALYATLFLHDFFPQEFLYTLNEGGTRLPSHPDRLKTPGVDATTGSLGQGTSVAAGIAFALHKENRDQNVFLIVGDGELNEGQCYEAFSFVASKNLYKLVTFIDYNKRQLDGKCEDIIKPFDLVKKMEAFGFHAKMVRGDDEEAISKAIEIAKSKKDKPSCIILDTIKGQGVEYYYNREDSHSPKFDDKSDEAIDKVIDQLTNFVKKEEV